MADTATNRDVKPADDEAELARVVKNLIKMPPESRRPKDDGGRGPRQDAKAQ